MSPNNDEIQLHSLISCPTMKLDPINTILGDIAGVSKVNNVPVRSKCVPIGEVLKSGEVDAGVLAKSSVSMPNDPSNSGPRVLGWRL